ncbi:LexA family transcriptional regulator [Massilia phyllosphaerae]|uniref:LexA family transcriptional regulator n=1 Tax=Massilia phyllosphaerae TaxID=3106034 RepID=UPI002B1CB212|nr:S24 family peptidase [Massilia sp. SGZ-792]
MNTLSDRLEHIYRAVPSLEGERGQTGLVKASGASKSVVNQWLTGKIKSMDIRYALNLERALGFSHIWLMTGQGEPHPAPDERPRNALAVRAVDSEDREFVQIAMVKLRLSAGITGFQTEPEGRDGGTLGMRRNWIERHNLSAEHLIAILVKGESMEPSLYEDDIVIINTLDKKPVDGAVYAFNYEGEAVVKRLARDAGQWWLTSDNPDQRKYHRKLCQNNACLVIGRVVRKESDRI